MLKLSITIVFLCGLLGIMLSNKIKVPNGRFKRDLSALMPHPGGVKFVFLVGMEGTGHHFYSEIIRQSPTMTKLIEEWGLHEKLMDLHNCLFNGRHKHLGLFSGLCHENGLRPQLGGKGDIFKYLVEQLKSIDDTVRSKIQEGHSQDKNDSKFIAVPLNSIFSTSAAGFLSYPDFMSDCRAMQYPNLDILYKACDSANVECSHIYLYRDLYEAIHSTVYKRRFGSLQHQIGIYMLMSSVIFTQMTTFKDRLLTCWNYDDIAMAGNIGPLYGWDSPESFLAEVEEIFRTKASLTAEEKSDIIPDEYKLYMDSLEDIHSQVLQICQDTNAENKIKT